MPRSHARRDTQPHSLRRSSVAAITTKLPSRSAASNVRSNPFKLAFARKLPDFRFGSRRNHAQPQAGDEQAADLFERDVAGADQQSAASIEFQKNRQQAHGDSSESELALWFRTFSHRRVGGWRTISVGNGVGHAAGGQIALDRRERFSGQVARAARHWCGARTMRADSRPPIARDQIVAQQALDRLGNQRRGAAIPNRARNGCVLPHRSAEAEVVGIGQLALVLDLLALDADVGDPVLAASVGASGYVQAQLLIKLRKALFQSRPPASA